MTGVRLELKGQDEALAQLAGYIQRARDPRGMFESIGSMLVTSTQRRFETSMSPDKSPWPPSLRVIAHGGKTLVESARLMRSITYEASDTGTQVGTNVIYAAIHQLGGEITQAARKGKVNFKTNKKTGARLPGFRKASKGTQSQEVNYGARTIRVPARPFLGLDDDDTKEILLIAQDWIAGDGKGAPQ